MLYFSPDVVSEPTPLSLGHSRTSFTLHTSVLAAADSANLDQELSSTVGAALGLHNKFQNHLVDWGKLDELLLERLLLELEELLELGLGRGVGGHGGAGSGHGYAAPAGYVEHGAYGGYGGKGGYGGTGG
jgi:hypothetical protein